MNEAHETSNTSDEPGAVAKPDAAPHVEAPAGTGNRPLVRVIVYGALVLFAAGVGFWWYFFQRPIAQLEQLEGRIERDEDGNVIRVYLNEKQITSRTLETLSRFESLRVINLAKSTLPESGFEFLAGSENLVVLNLRETNVNDAHLAEIGKIESMKQIALWGCKSVTDKGLKQINGLPNLWQLTVGATPITDEGVLALPESLKDLNLMGCKKVTDKSVESLMKRTKLTLLNIVNTGISAEGAEQIQKALPKCRVMSEEPASSPPNPPGGDQPTPKKRPPRSRPKQSSLEQFGIRSTAAVGRSPRSATGCSAT